jgi:hypothetical protein
MTGAFRSTGVLALIALAGCSSTAEQTSQAFVDPARYALYDCNQLITEYRSVMTRENELNELMAKARTGFAGEFMAEAGYSTDYLTIHGRRRSIEQVAAENKCNLSAQPSKRAAPPPRPMVNQNPTVR